MANNSRWWSKDVQYNCDKPSSKADDWWQGQGKWSWSDSSCGQTAKAAQAEEAAIYTIDFDGVMPLGIVLWQCLHRLMLRPLPLMRARVRAKVKVRMQWKAKVRAKAMGMWILLKAHPLMKAGRSFRGRAKQKVNLGHWGRWLGLPLGQFWWLGKRARQAWGERDQSRDPVWSWQRLTHFVACCKAVANLMLFWFLCLGRAMVHPESQVWFERSCIFRKLWPGNFGLVIKQRPSLKAWSCWYSCTGQHGGHDPGQL